MQYYIFFKNKNLPSGMGAMEYIYDKSFRKQLFSGGKYSKRLGYLPYIIQFRWPKWIDNKMVTSSVSHTSINVYFYPFDKSIKANKRIVNIAFKNKFKYVAMIEIDNSPTQKNMIARIDLRTFFRTVQLYSKYCKGSIFISPKMELLNDDEFYNLFKKFIKIPFSRKLKKGDVKLLDVTPYL